jgi:uncharacterized SAM-binding protein YcdF (DUF218 family)
MMGTVWLRIVGGTTLGLCAVSAFTPVPELISAVLRGSGAVEQVPAIVVLGAGVREDGMLSDASLRRTMVGIELYRKGVAPLIVLSGPISPSGRVEAELRQAVARDCAVPGAALLTESRGRTTHEEALNITGLLRSRDIGRAAVVADAEQATRARGAFRAAGLDVVTVPVSDVAVGATSPSGRLAVARRVVMELLAWTYYRVAGYL